jgi:RimJ/RimL family protein N-acetyltransferase
MQLLHGEHIYLTAPTLDALAILMLQMNSMDYLRWADLDTAYASFTAEKLLDWMRDQRKNATGYPFVIRLQADDRPIGACGLYDVNWHSRKAEVGIGLADVADRGKSFGSDAMRVLLRYGFDIVNVNRIGLRVASYNTGAITSYEKVGFKVDATLREAVYRDRQYHDVLIMSILRAEWSRT